MVYLTTIINLIEPKTSNRPGTTPTQKKRSIWRKVIKDKLRTMKKKNVLYKVIPQDENQVTIPLGMKWFMKIKDNSR